MNSWKEFGIKLWVFQNNIKTILNAWKKLEDLKKGIHETKIR